MFAYPALFLFKSVAELLLISTIAHKANLYLIDVRQAKCLEYEPGADMAMQVFSYKILSDSGFTRPQIMLLKIKLALHSKFLFIHYLQSRKKKTSALFAEYQSDDPQTTEACKVLIR